MNHRARELHSEAMKKKESSSKWEHNVKLNHVVPLLRQVCMHAHLIEYPLDEYGEYALDDRLLSCSGKMQVLHKLLTMLKKGGHKVSFLIRGKAGFHRYVRMLCCFQTNFPTKLSNCRLLARQKNSLPAKHWTKVCKMSTSR